MIFVCTLVSLLFLPILSFKEIKPKLCINFKRFIEDNELGKCSLFIKEQVKDVYSLMDGFEKIYTKKCIKGGILNETVKDHENIAFDNNITNSE